MEEDCEEEGEEEQEPTKVVEEIAQFDEMVIWGHEELAADDDIFVRGVEEWIGFAEAMHSYETLDESK